jgi:hypothetical protein
LQDANSRQETDYTPESWSDANLSAVIDAAKKVHDDPNSTQDQVDAQVAALNDALGKLEKALDSIAISHPADKLVYTVGDTLDITGLVVTGTYKDGSTTELPITVSNVKDFDSTVPVEGQILTITVDSLTTTYTVDIKPAPVVLENIEISQLPEKLEYFVNEPLDITGLIIKGQYSDGSEQELPVTLGNVSGFDSRDPAEGQELTITIEDKTVTYMVDIKVPESTDQP